MYKPQANLHSPPSLSSESTNTITLNCSIPELPPTLNPKPTYKFSLPINLSRLQTSRLKLVPYENVKSSFLPAFHQETSLTHPEVYRFLRYGPFANASGQDSYEEWYDHDITPDSGATLFAIYIKPGTTISYRKPKSHHQQQPTVLSTDTATSTTTDSTTSLPEDWITPSDSATLAGITGLLDTSAEHRYTEIGHIIILPRFHRTFVQRSANALLLRHLLDSREDGGLAMRRVQWMANDLNSASVNAAKGLGFTYEGTVRWFKVLPPGKEGREVGYDPEGEGEDEGVRGRVGRGVGRHTAMLSFCWDDWIGGGREKVAEILEG